MFGFTRKPIKEPWVVVRTMRGMTNNPPSVSVITHDRISRRQAIKTAKQLNIIRPSFGYCTATYESRPATTEELYKIDNL